MLKVLNDLLGEDALSINHRLHSQRMCRNKIASPQTKRICLLLPLLRNYSFDLAQMEQVRIVLDEMFRKTTAETNIQETI